MDQVEPGDSIHRGDGPESSVKARKGRETKKAGTIAPAQCSEGNFRRKGWEVKSRNQLLKVEQVRRIKLPPRRNM